MLIKYAFLYCTLEREISRLESYLKAERAKHPTSKVLFNPPPPDSDVIFILNTLKNDSLKVHIPSVKAQIVRIEARMKNPFDVEEMITCVHELRNRLQDDLESQHFLYVSDDVASYYKDAGSLFGEQIIAKFPEIIDDGEGAGRCLALGEGTACVMHLMRVMEVGLRALSKSLGIPYAPSWESHLKQIEKVSRKSTNKKLLLGENMKTFIVM